MPNVIKIISAGTKGAKKAVNKINKELKKRSIDDSKAYLNSKGKVIGSNQGDYTVLKGSNRKIAVTARNTPVKKTSGKKSGLETRGAKPTKAEAIDRARDYQWNKAEKYMEQRFDTMAGGPRAGGANRGPGKKNTAKSDSVSRLARQTIPVKTPKVPVKKKTK